MNYTTRKFLAGLSACFLSLGSWGQTTFNYTGTVETYTVPAGVTAISIQAFGAQGGNSNGGLGASIYGEFSVTPGMVLNIVVGQQGVVNNCGGPGASGGGGGGSFVWDPLNTALPMVAAGGGGGGNTNWTGGCIAGLPGQAGQNGTSGANGYAAGGVGGQGGAGNAPSGTGAGGGGWLSPGQNSTYDPNCQGGQTYATFIGGNGSATFGPGGEGGFGGGGGAVCGCGGGGGFSGGAGGEGSTCRAGGGGGGSYNGGTNQTNTTGVRSGNGQIIITPLCNALITQVSSTSICLGDSVTLNAGSNNLNATVSWDNGVISNVPFVPATSGTHTYTATSTDPNDCGFSVDIDVFDLPSVSAHVDFSEVCEGELVTLGVNGNAHDYSWSPIGTMDSVAFAPSVGLNTYMVEALDTISGCTNQESVDVMVYAPIQITVVATDEMFGADGTIDVTITGGKPPYSYDWDNDGTGDFDDTEDLNGLTQGMYNLVVSDQSSCSDSSVAVQIFSQVGINELTASEFQLFPNPTKEIFNVVCPGSFQFEVTDASGESIVRSQGVDNAQVSMKAFASGVYFVHISTEKESKTLKLIKR